MSVGFKVTPVVVVRVHNPACVVAGVYIPLLVTRGMGGLLIQSLAALSILARVIAVHRRKEAAEPPMLSAWPPDGLIVSPVSAFH